MAVHLNFQNMKDAWTLCAEAPDGWPSDTGRKAAKRWHATLPAARVSARRRHPEEQPIRGRTAAWARSTPISCKSKPKPFFMHARRCAGARWHRARPTPTSCKSKPKPFFHACADGARAHGGGGRDGHQPAGGAAGLLRAPHRARAGRSRRQRPRGHQGRRAQVPHHFPRAGGARAALQSAGFDALHMVAFTSRVVAQASTACPWQRILVWVSAATGLHGLQN